VIVGIDSMILIYAEIVPSNPATRSADFADLRDRATLLLHMRKDDTIVLPTVAMSELLVPVPKAERGALIAILRQKFVCPPFDLPAASIAADLWSQHRDLPQDQKYGKRHVVRPDCMILASARAAGATEFYTHDKKCRILANLAGLTPHDLPTRDPNDMFWQETLAAAKPGRDVGRRG
jgi:hypothetical protein